MRLFLQLQEYSSVVVQYEIGLAGIGSTVVADTDCRLSKPWVKVIDKGVSEDFIYSCLFLGVF